LGLLLFLLQVEVSVLTELRLLEFLLARKRALVGELASLLGCSEELVVEIARKYSDLISVSGGELVVTNRLELALLLSERGVELKRISEYLDWRDFEVFSSRILEEFGYIVERGVTLTSPVRFEIDVLGVDPTSGLGLVIDCKHWSLATRSRLVEAAARHAERVDKLVKYYSRAKQKYRVLEKASKLLPLIVTLLTPRIRVHENVLFVSIRELPVLLRDIHLVLDQYEVKPRLLPRY
jgi:hypothetical protein